MTHDLIYPEAMTYFIAWEGDVVAYGTNDTNQTTTTGLANFETFTDMGLYLARLLELGVNPGEEED